MALQTQILILSLPHGAAHQRAGLRRLLALAEQPEALANYYDMLANDAFGNFRQLLQDVTLSPVMGNYLNMLRNAAANPAKGTSADENYAREVMQLFTIGLNVLNPDGTLQLDSNGQPIPTYDQHHDRPDRQRASPAGPTTRPRPTRASPAAPPTGTIRCSFFPPTTTTPRRRSSGGA